MAKPLKDDRPKIQMLLDVENIFGESTRGLGTFVLTIVVGLIPVVFIAYTALYIYVPWQILLTICIIWFIRSVMIIYGCERDRLVAYKKQRDDVYSLTDDMINVRRIHEQGCVEYMDGSVMFLIVTYNDSSTNTVAKSRAIDRFLSIAVGKEQFDIYVQNLTGTDQLDTKYNNVTLFTDDEAARAFMEIIDYNREVVASTSTLTRNIIAVRGSKYKWKEILMNIQSALASESARVFRQCYLATDRQEIEEIISRDINGYVELDQMMQKRFGTGRKHGAKIISYDFEDLLQEETEVVEQDVSSSFIPKY